MTNKFRKYKKASISMDEVKERQKQRREYKAKMQVYRKVKHAAMVLKHGLPPIVAIKYGVNRWSLEPASHSTFKFSGRINDVYWAARLVRGGSGEDALKNHGHEVYRFEK